MSATGIPLLRAFQLYYGQRKSQMFLIEGQPVHRAAGVQREGGRCHPWQPFPTTLKTCGSAWTVDLDNDDGTYVRTRGSNVEFITYRRGVCEPMPSLERVVWIRRQELEIGLPSYVATPTTPTTNYNTDCCSSSGIGDAERVKTTISGNGERKPSS